MYGFFFVALVLGTTVTHGDERFANSSSEAILDNAISLPTLRGGTRFVPLDYFAQ